MPSFKKYCKAGEPTACAPDYFVELVRLDRAPLFDTFPSVAEAVSHFEKVFTSFDRWEYVITDNTGKVEGVLVFLIDEYDLHKGQPVISPLMAFSKNKGALSGAYKWMFQIAKEHGIKWALIQRGEGQSINCKYREIKQ